MSDTPFEFQSKPFSSVPDAGCFVELPMYQEAISGLRDWAESGEGVALLTGAAGLGKTLICHRLMSDVEQNIQVVLLPHGNFPNVLSFLKSLLFQLNCNYAGLDEDELRLELGGALQDLAGTQGQLLLMIDGAHEMDESMLLEVQNLASMAESSSFGLSVLLAGQLELEELLTRRSLSSLNQRLRTHQILENLTRSESADYLAGRIEWAGNDIEAVMTEEAVETMTHLSDGVPRCLNRIAETSLRIASQRHVDAVDKACVREAFEDVRHLPLHWNAWPDESLASNDAVNTAEVGSEDNLEEVLENAKVKESLPDLKSEAEEAGVEYAVAEFGGEEESEDSSVLESLDAAETSEPDQSVLDLSQSVPQNAGDEYDDSHEYVSRISADSITAENQSDLDGLVEMMNAVNSQNTEASANAAVDLSQSGPVVESPYMKSGSNPVDIFAVDVPEDEPVAPTYQDSFEVTEGGAAIAVATEVQQIISQEVENVAQKEVHSDPGEQSTEQASEYDVIEPEAIPELARIRPSLEIDLPHRPPQPRYRNLFRDLRRRRG